MRTYLVTGGAGFIGSNYIHYMLKKYGEEIRIIDISKVSYVCIKLFFFNISSFFWISFNIEINSSVVGSTREPLLKTFLHTKLL